MLVRGAALIPSPADLPDDAALTLSQACFIFFPDVTGSGTPIISPSSLRAERRRGNLKITRVGKKDLVTAGAVREMMKKCHDQPRELGSTSTPKSGSGSSETDRSRDALAAAKAISQELKRNSPNISRQSSNQPPAKVISIDSRSRRS